MSVCQDCHKPVEWGRGWGGMNVCASCRGKRASASAKRRAALSGKVHGDKRGSDPLVAGRSW
jgi:hypothetical protein